MIDRQIDIINISTIKNLLENHKKNLEETIFNKLKEFYYIDV